MYMLYQCTRLVLALTVHIVTYMYYIVYISTVLYNTYWTCIYMYSVILNYFSST